MIWYWVAYLFVLQKAHTLGTQMWKPLSKVVSTHLWNTSLNLYQQAIKDSFHNWLGGLPGVCSWGVLQFSWTLVYWDKYG